ncbi:MAG: alpha-L-fucosidase, partial [Bacteroidales bacterium]
VNCVSKGGNLLVNVGPDALGRIPDPSIEILEEVGNWMERNYESIYGCGMADFAKPDWGRFTQKGNILYAHIFDQNIGQFCLENLNGKVESARLLRDGSEVILSGFWNGDDKPFVKPSDLFMSLGKPLPHTHRLLDSRDTVVKLLLKK